MVILRTKVEATYFAIQHVPSGKFLPAGTPGRRRGFTHDEPQDFNEQVPRLFRSMRGASNALNWWLAGTATRGYSRDWESGHYEEGNIECTPRPDRKAEDMQIVPVTLTTRVQ